MAINIGIFAASFLLITTGIKKLVDAADTLNSKSGNVGHTIGLALATLGLFAGLIVAIMVVNKKITMFDAMKMKTNSIVRFGLTMALLTTALVPLALVTSLLADMVENDTEESIKTAGGI